MNDNYLYQMVVFTGIRKNAGTSAKVNIFVVDKIRKDICYIERFILF